MINHVVFSNVLTFRILNLFARLTSHSIGDQREFSPELFKESYPAPISISIESVGKQELIGICSVALLCWLSFQPTTVSGQDDRPNVVFFLVDDLGWTDLGCYGSDFYETPNIDTFCTTAVSFRDAYAACHVCSPTRASILTGKYPARLQLTDWIPGRREFDFQPLLNAPNLQHLPLEETTLAEALQELGYATGHFGKWHLGDEPFGPTAQGFDVQVPQYNVGWPRAGYYAPFRLPGLDDQPGDYLTDRLTDEAIGFIRNHQTQPFFLYLSHFAVHDPIHGREDLVEKYQAKFESLDDPQSPVFQLEGNPDSPNQLTREERLELLRDEAYQTYEVLPDRLVKIKQRQDNVQFAAMVEAMDDSFGRVIDQLETLELLDKHDCPFFFSDNGGMSAANFGNPNRVIDNERLDGAYSTSNLPLRGAKGWLYEGGIRVPLMIRWPNHGLSDHSCEVPVISTDFYPTILEMIGAEPKSDQHLDGVSLASLLKGESELSRDAIYWHFPHYSNHGMQSPGGAIRMGNYKLIEYFEQGNVQLFDLSRDLGESNDISESEPEMAQRLRERLHDWRIEVAASVYGSESSLLAKRISRL